MTEPTFHLYDMRTGKRLREATDEEVHYFFNVKAKREGWPPGEFPDLPEGVEEVWVDVTDPSEQIACWYEDVPIFRGWVYPAVNSRGRSCKAKADEVAAWAQGSPTRFTTITINPDDCGLPPETVLDTWRRETRLPKTWKH